MCQERASCAVDALLPWSLTSPPHAPHLPQLMPLVWSREAHYSRGIRQEVHRLAKSRSWDKHHKILVGDHAANGSYADYLMTSIFCLVLPGEDLPMSSEAEA